MIGSLDQDRFDKLRLIRSSNIGPVSYVQMLKRFGDASSALQSIPNMTKEGGTKAPRIATVSAIEREMQAVSKLGGSYVFLGEPDYPELLSEISNPPPALIYRGNTSLLRNVVVAIVGARNASAAACRFARDLANDLGGQGLVVASGLARGIDTAAHEGSIVTGTVAVIAGGIDVSYPPENSLLQGEVAEQGLLLSEQPPGVEPRARHFPYRNRIIAGLARGTVVIEAAPKSGSLTTARMTAEAGREVMAVPGSPLDPRSQGCNALIREGANLVQSADDVVELLRPIDERAEPIQTQHRSADLPRTTKSREQTGIKYRSINARKRVTDLLSNTPVAINEIIRQSQVDSPTVQLVLLELELAGQLSRHAGARVGLKS